MDETDGVWVVFSYDIGPFPMEMFPASEKGRAAANQAVVNRGYGDVTWWPFGDEFFEAIKSYEKRRATT